MQECVDDAFFDSIEPFIRKAVELNYYKYSVPPVHTVDEILGRLMKAYKDKTNVLFLHVPGVNAEPWSEKYRKMFKKHVPGASDYEEPWHDYTYLEVEGTTFSGHSTKTTLGNTLRSLCYAWYYLMDAGVSDTPWDMENIYVVASGDDVVIWTMPEDSEKLQESILNLTCRAPADIYVGLG